jgi:hypothetical protein
MHKVVEYRAKKAEEYRVRIHDAVQDAINRGWHRYDITHRLRCHYNFVGRLLAGKKFQLLTLTRIVDKLHLIKGEPENRWENGRPQMPYNRDKGVFG